MKPAARVVAIVGAESTGKSTLAQGLAEALQVRTGGVAVWVGERLRDWCQERGRTPRQDEQAQIAAEQQRLIEQACAGAAWVVADTTPLMTAVYSQLLFKDRSLWAPALAWHGQHAHLTLVTANDVPWVADALRDGPHVRQPVRRMLTARLNRAQVNWVTVRGRNGQRLTAALRHLEACGLLPAV